MASGVFSWAGSGGTSQGSLSRPVRRARRVRLSAGCLALALLWTECQPRGLAAAPPPSAAEPGAEPDAKPTTEGPQALVGEAIDPREWQQLPLETGPLVVRQGVRRLTKSLRFSGDGVWLAGPGAVLDLNGHTIYYGEDGRDDRHGVHYYLDWADQDRPPLAGAQEPSGARVTNGRLVHIGGGGRCHGIAGHRATAAVIDRVVTLVRGQDTASVMFRWGDAQVLASTLVSLSDRTADRHVMPANVELGAGSRVEGNVILGGNAGVHVAENSRVVGNFIAHHSFATNGYGAGCYRSERVVIRDNVIAPLISGRGIAFNAGRDLVADSNVILAWELPNAEYGWELNAAGIRVRYEAAGCRVMRNTVLAVGGGEHVSASALYLSDYEPTNDYRGNRLLAICLPQGPPPPGSDQAPPANPSAAVAGGATQAEPAAEPVHDDHGQYAKCLTLEGQGGPEGEHPATDRLVGNRLRGNHYLISTSGPDGGCRQTEPAWDFELAWIDGAKAREEFLAAARAKLDALGLLRHPLVAEVLGQLAERLAVLDQAGLRPDRRTWFTGYWGPVEELTLIGCRAADDSQAPVGFELTDLTAENLRESPRTFRLGRAINVQLTSGGQPLARAALLIENERGERLRAFADAAGRVRLPVIDYALEKPPGKDLPFSRVERKTVRISAAGYRQQTLPVENLPAVLELVAE